MGRVYLIEHCVYEHNRKQERRAYETYVTDRLKGINDSVAGFLGGRTASKRYFDILMQMSNTQPEETRTADEIISSISKKLERLGNNESI